MDKVKKDKLSEKTYNSMKKHPILKNPIVLVYLGALIILAASYIFYLFFKESI